MGSKTRHLKDSCLGLKESGVFLKPYICDYCRKAFRTADGKASHMKHYCAALKDV